MSDKNEIQTKVQIDSNFVLKYPGLQFFKKFYFSTNEEIVKTWQIF